jgi:excinuclease ABC subunit C
MNSQQFKKIRLPSSSGVYFFYKGRDILYIGKATSLRDRVKSYLGKELINTRGPAILDMVTQATSIKWQETDSVLEALILEANLIKKYQPKYNTKEKDNKSFNYVCITDEKIPKVLIVRGRDIFSQQHANSSRFTPKGPYATQNLHVLSKKYGSVFGPFPNGSQLKEAMKIIRRIFPYVDNDSIKKNNKVFYEQLELTPENILEYKNNIKNLKLFFEGKKKSVINNFKKEMFSFAKKKEFEKADIIKKRIFALNHINDVALIKEDISQIEHFARSSDEGGRGARPSQNALSGMFRIEAYDIAHMAGSNMVGVMTVIEDGELAKNEYKKFIIRTQTASNDTGALEEVLSRRLRHIEWGLPNLVVMDGGTAQVNIAKSVLDRYRFKIPVVSVVKDDRHKAKAIMGDKEIIKKYKKEILLINSESHRFAITFHKKRRNKNFLI